MMMLTAQTEQLMVEMIKLTHPTIMRPGLDDQRGPSTLLQGKYYVDVALRNSSRNFSIIVGTDMLRKERSARPSICHDSVLICRVLLVPRKEDENILKGHFLALNMLCIFKARALKKNKYVGTVHK